MLIETERLVLRDVVAADEAAMYAYRRDPRYLEFYDDAEGTPEATRRLVELFLAWQRAAPRRRFQLAVMLRESGLLIGNCGVRRKAENDFEADIGYELNPEHWGRGYATEAARAMVAYGFKTLGLGRISSWCISENVRSAHVLEKVGMRLEGRLRRNAFFKRRWWDTSLYGLLREEWAAQP